MKNKELLKIISEEADVFFQKMGFESRVFVEEKNDEGVSVAVDLDEPHVLIGKRGETLFSCQHILSKLIRKKTDKEIIIDLDINEYKKRKIDFLKEKAKNLADEVVLKKTEKELEPMPPYERRIVHMALSERKDVTTQSYGQEPQRKIIIKPK